MYKMCDIPRGVCMIINNTNFKQARENGQEHMHDRDGSDIDSGEVPFEKSVIIGAFSVNSSWNIANNVPY